MPRPRSPRSLLRAGLVAVLLLLLIAPTGLAAFGRDGGAPAPRAILPPASTSAPMVPGVPLVHGLSSELRPHATHPRDQPAGPNAPVDPFNFYTVEPAPIGVADFGLDGLGNSYSYHTDQFLGVTYLRNFSVYNANDGLPTTVSIQLNVVLTFSVGGASYQYWIQDVSFYDTAAMQPTFLNNIWNLSSSSMSMDSNSMSGNGSVYGNLFYEYSATGTGNGVTLPSTSEIDLRVNESTVNNQPAVAFQYQDGYGWQTYDNVVFPFAKGATGTSYIVDGTQYAPDGLYDDAEIILGGPGGGTSTSATYANLSMALETWNGHNFQAVRNTYNFGSDTAEGIDGLAMARSGGTMNATLTDELSHGSGTLGKLYSSSYAALLNVTTDVPNGSLIVGDGVGIAFVGNQINATIAPGAYTAALYNATGSIAFGNFTVAPGGYAALTLLRGTVFAVQFTETGLFGNKKWTVALGAASLNTRSPSLTFFMVNGNYSYRVTPIPGFILNNSRGAVPVASADQSILLPFWAVLYDLQLYETGLPLNTSWSVTVRNQTFSSNGVSMTFGLPNGSWNFKLGLIPGWSAASNGVGSFQVNAVAQRQTIAFHAFRLPILFQANGLPLNTFWYLRIGNDWTNGSISTLRGNEPNGSYPYLIEGSAGWAASPPRGNVTVAGAAVFLNVSFIPFTFPIVFEVQGLPNGTAWGLRLGTVYWNSTDATITMELANGSYAATVNDVPGYDRVAPVLNFTVAGASLHETVTFTVPPTYYGEVSGTIAPAGALLFVDGVATVYSGGSFSLHLAVGTHAILVSLTGYHSYDHNVTVTAGSTVLLTISLQPIHPQGPGSTQNITRTVAGSTQPASELLAAGLGIAILAAVGLGALLARARRPKQP